MFCLNNNYSICDHNIEYPNIDEYNVGVFNVVVTNVVIIVETEHR